MSPLLNMRLLQAAITILCVVPLTASLAGMFGGPAAFDPTPAGIDIDSHYRYLSGIFLGVALGFLSCIPNVAAKTARFRFLTMLVVLGGLGRLISLLMEGEPSWPHLAGLVLELGVVPLVALWQARVAREQAA